MKLLPPILANVLLLAALPGAAPAQTASATESAADTNPLAWLSQPLSLPDCLNLALRQNATILKSQRDLEAAHGMVVQTRAIAIPKVRVTGDYSIMDQGAIERLEFELPPGIAEGLPTGINPGDQRWSANIRLVQSIYEGGRIRSALRAARLTREQALLRHQAVIADTLLEVRVAYDDILLAQQHIAVQAASLRLLEEERADAQRRCDAGTVPRFNVLRAEVEVANAKPRLIRARNAHRIAKNNLANLLGFDLPRDVWEDLPFKLSGRLEEAEAAAMDLKLPEAIAQAVQNRPELGALRKAEALQREAIKTAKGGFLPSAQVFVGYGSHNSSFYPDLDRDVSGWQAGAQVSWDLFDGFLTKGKVAQAMALHEKSVLETEDATRRIELEVRTAYSNFIEAREVLASQKKVQEQAEEALRLAVARNEAGTGTQLDVLNAQTALTEARTTQVQALHDYSVALARLERAVGLTQPMALSENE